MSGRRSRLFFVIAVFATFSLEGCRVPKLFLKPPQETLYYDTAYEQELAGKPEPAPDSLEYDFRWRYRDSLAEPVALVSYQKDAFSEWDVLFATNREPKHVNGSQQVRFENEYSERLNYGRCSVSLTEPSKEELAEAQPEGVVGKVVEILPKSWQEEIVFDEAKYTSVEDITSLATEKFYRRLNQRIVNSRQKDVLIFVHGFNVDFESSVGRLAQIARDMPFNGAVIAYSWPSQGGVDNYKRDGEVVNDSIAPFQEFLNDLNDNLPSDTKVNIVVHSMGNRLAMRSISKLRYLEEDQPPRFESIVLCAPDVGVEEFKRIGPAVIDSAKRTTLYRCLNDSALIASSYRNKEERAGGSYAPIILEGMDTVECAVIDTSILGHSYYGSNPHMLRDLFCILKEAKSAAERPWMKRQKIPFQGDLWIIADWPLQLEWTWHLPVQDQKLAMQTEQQILQTGHRRLDDAEPPDVTGKAFLAN